MQHLKCGQQGSLTACPSLLLEARREGVPCTRSRRLRLNLRHEGREGGSVAAMSVPCKGVQQWREHTA